MTSFFILKCEPSLQAEVLERTNLKPSSDQVTEIPDLCDDSFETLLTNLVGDETGKLTESQIDQLKAVSPNPFYLTVIYDELAKFNHTDEHVQNILDFRMTNEIKISI